MDTKNQIYLETRFYENLGDTREISNNDFTLFVCLWQWDILGTEFYGNPLRK